ncbi:hypothetical protein Q7P37_001204 [Cladosporium fusiforme]
MSFATNDTEDQYTSCVHAVNPNGLDMLRRRLSRSELNVSDLGQRLALPHMLNATLDSLVTVKMRFAPIAILGASLAAAQQYEGDSIPGTLPTVDNAEVAYWKIRDPSGDGNNLTLINYASLDTQGQRPDNANIQRAVFSIHGLLRDPWNYENDMLNALNQATSYNENVNRDTVAVVAPYFASGSDKDFAYPWDDTAKAGRGSNTSALVWRGSQWSAGGDAQYPRESRRSVSAFYVLDEMIKYFDDKERFPKMQSIVLVGHSMGGQMLNRYAAVGKDLKLNAKLVHWIGNPSGYTWLNSYRPMYVPDCPDYDDYREGYSNYEDYPMTYNTELVAEGSEAILKNFQSKQIAWARALQDMGDHSSACGANTTGANRNERFFNFVDWFRPSCEDPEGRNCDTVDLIDTSHNNGFMFNSPAGQSRIFHDNFDGKNDIAYDYGYPRAQDGDNPHPDPGAVDSAGPYMNSIPQEWVYGGEMTYSGCWSDDESATLEHQAFSDDTVSVDGCTETCAGDGWAIAGLKEGNQCWCGNSLQGFASRVVDMSCHLPCAGNDGQTCGGPNRFSLYSAEDDSDLINKRSTMAAPMRFASMNERVAAMADKNWRPRIESLTKDSPKPDENLSPEDAVDNVEASDELSDEEQNLENGNMGGQDLIDNGQMSNGTMSSSAPSWAAGAAQAAEEWEKENASSSASGEAPSSTVAEAASATNSAVAESTEGPQEVNTDEVAGDAAQDQQQPSTEDAPTEEAAPASA